MSTRHLLGQGELAWSRVQQLLALARLYPRCTVAQLARALRLSPVTVRKYLDRYGVFVRSGKDRRR